jgi:antitoxin component of MazEF toxin-antitoxin module
MATLTEVFTQLDGKARLGADDALSLRRVLYGGDQIITEPQARALITLNADAGEVSPEWRMLFIEALTDFVVHQQQPSGYVDQAKAAWLIEAVSRDRCAKDDELEVLVCVLEKAEQTPASLSAFTLSVLADHVRQRPGGPAITREDVERLRRVVFAVGGDQNIGVSRAEAEALFDLNDAVKGAENDPAWTDFFAKAVANAVLFETPYHAPTAEAELRREDWLADTHIHLFGERFRGIWSDRAPQGGAQGHAPASVESAWRDGLAADAALEARAEQVTAPESHWLADRIGRDGDFDVNERALVAFLAANAAAIDPALRPLIARLSER